MTGNATLVTTVLFVHSLLTVLWVGGMMTLGIVVVPAGRSMFRSGPQMMRLMSVVQSRLRWCAYVAMVGLAITGILLSRRSSAFEGFFTWGDTYAVALSLKHALMAVMVIVALVRSLALHPPIPTTRVVPPAGHLASDTIGSDTAPAAPESAGRMKVSMVLLYGNIALGIAVLFLSALTAAVA